MYIPIRPKHYTYLCHQSQFISSNSRIFDMSALSEFMMCPLIIGTPIHQFNHRAGHSRKGPSINYVVLVGGGGREAASKTIYYTDTT